MRLALFVSACCLVSCLAKYWWVADLIANLRVQLLIGMVLSLVCLAIGQQWNWLLGVTLLTLWQLSTLSSAWYLWEAFPFGLVLDHALYSKELHCVARQILPYNGSDHRGVLYRFRLSSSD